MQNFASVLFALSVLGSSAIASAQTPPSAAPNPPPSTGITGSQNAAEPNFAQVISSLNNMRAEIRKVQSMNGASANAIKPVDVAQLSGSDPSTLNTAMTRNQSQLASLRNALARITVTSSSNQRITVAQFLADNKIGLTQVVGADVNNGTLLLFYQKP